MEMLKGYIKTKGKKPIEPYRNKKSFYTYDHIRKTGGDFAGILADGMVQIDIDDEAEAKLVKQMVEDLGLRCAILKTDRGIHFYFRNTEVKKKQTKLITPIGVTVDVAVGEQNAPVPIRVLGETRRWLNKIDMVEDIDFLPDWLRPLKKKNSVPDFRSLADGDGRNQALFNYILTLQAEGFGKEAIKGIIQIINRHVLKTPLGDKEVETILRDEAFLKQTFYIKSKFLHDRFAKYLKTEERIIKINNQLHIYRDGIYKNDVLEIETAMIKHLPELNRAKRSETLTYLDLIAEGKEPASANYIGFANGILDIESMTMHDFSADIVLQNKIDYDFIPGAYEQVVDQTLDKICCQDNNLRKLLEELVGYLFFRRNELGKCFILTGGGSNGKSTFLDMIKNLLGNNNYSSLGIDELGVRFKTAELFHKLANVGDDISKKYMDDSAIFKKLVTGETVNAERKGKDPFEFNNYAKLLFSTNKLPRINDTSVGLMRRLVIIPFNAVFSDKDTDFDPFIKDKLLTKPAMEYLLKLGIEGLTRVLASGFTEAQAAKREKRDYEVVNNPILAFVNEGLKIENETIKDVYRKYGTWCYENGLKPLSHIEFGRELSKNGYQSEVRRIGGETVRIYVKAATDVTNEQNDL